MVINGTPAPIAYASPSRLDVQLPYEVGPGSAGASVTVPCGTTAPYSFQVAQAAPYVFQTNSGDAVALNQDQTVNGPDNPAAVGSVITVSLTGIGPVDNPVTTGAPAPGSPPANAKLAGKATIGGWDTTIQFLGLSPQSVGKAQANLVVPGLSTGVYAVIITVGGVDSNGPNVYVK